MGMSVGLHVVGAVGSGMPGAMDLSSKFQRMGGFGESLS